MSREKQIEEIAVELNEIIRFNDKGFVDRYATAEAIYDAKYRKTSNIDLLELQLELAQESQKFTLKSYKNDVHELCNNISRLKAEIEILQNELSETRVVARRATNLLDEIERAFRWGNYKRAEKLADAWEMEIC